MAALNQTETKVLRDVHTLVTHVLNNGFDPNSQQDGQLARGLKARLSELETVIQMKGYYPS